MLWFTLHNLYFPSNGELNANNKPKTKEYNDVVYYSLNV